MKPLLQMVAAVSLSCFSSALPVPVIVTPASVSMKTAQRQQFAASPYPGCVNSKIAWSTDKGTISSTGLYTASDAGLATITATPTYCPRHKGSVQVNVTAGAPTTYPLARTDHNIEQLPNPMPDWGGALGARKTWANPAFPGTVYTRLSDASTHRANTLQTADSGEPQLFSADGLHVIVRNTFSHNFIVGIDGSKTGVDSGYGSLGFTSHEPLQLFGLNGTQIRLLTVKPDWSGIASDVLVFDYATANCLGVGYKSTWHGTFTVSDDDLMFKTGFSNIGAQGTGHLAVAWSAATGCFVYDSLAGTVSGPAGLIGSIDDGVNPFPVRFYQHEAGGSPTSKYSLVGNTVHTKGGLPGCVVGPCLISEPYIWEIGTTHVRSCDIKCDGHSAKGRMLYTGKRYVSHSYDNVDQPIIPMVIFPQGFPDQHGTAHNQTTGAEPIFLVSTDVTPVIPYPIWGYDEVIEIPSDGSMVIGRMGQTMNTGKSRYFICQNAVGVIAQDGHHLVITSDMGGDGALGFEADGVTPRCDAFLLTF
jgi:Bacterial Ig-like domain (group 2)